MCKSMSLTTVSSLPISRQARTWAAHAAWARAGYSLRARFGSRPTVPLAGWWHGNDEIVEVFERRPR